MGAVAAVATKAEALTPPGPYSENCRRDYAQLAEQVRNTHEIFVDDSTPFDLLLRGDYWHSIADRLETRDLLYVTPLSGGWLAEMRVIYADRRSKTVQVALLRKHDLPKPTPSVQIGLPRGWEVRWINDKDRFGVFRDNTCLRDGFHDAEAAAEYARSHNSLK